MEPTEWNPLSFEYYEPKQSVGSLIWRLAVLSLSDTSNVTLISDDMTKIYPEKS